jgi:hypothetical protein
MHKNRELTGNKSATLIKRDPLTPTPQQAKSELVGDPVFARDFGSGLSPQQSQKRQLLGTPRLPPRHPVCFATGPGLAHAC